MLEDTRIVELYWARDEAALTESEQKYGGFCKRVAMNILSSREDAEECVQDTWHNSWNAMPPARPNALAAFFGRIVR